MQDMGNYQQGMQPDIGGCDESSGQPAAGQAGPTGPTGQAGPMGQPVPGQMGSGQAGGAQGGCGDAGMDPGVAQMYGGAPQEESCSCGDSDGGGCSGSSGQGGSPYPQGGAQAAGPHPSQFSGPAPGYYGPAPGMMGNPPHPGMYGTPNPGPQPYQGPPPGYGPIPAGPGAPYMGYAQPGPQGYAQPGPQGYAQPGPQGYAQPGASSQSGHSCGGGSSQGPTAPKHDAHQYGQLLGLMNDIANGNADASRVMAYMDGLDTQFWKGAMVGMAATLLVSNDTVKKTVTDALSSVWGVFQKEGSTE